MIHSGFDAWRLAQHVAGLILRGHVAGERVTAPQLSGACVRSPVSALSAEDALTAIAQAKPRRLPSPAGARERRASSGGWSNSGRYRGSSCVVELACRGCEPLRSVGEFGGDRCVSLWRSCRYLSTSAAAVHAGGLVSEPPARCWPDGRLRNRRPMRRPRV